MSIVTARSPSGSETATAFGVSLDWASRQVVVAGPVSPATSRQLLEAINVLRRTSPGPLTVDLQAVDRLQLAGMVALDEACGLQNHSGSTLALRITDRQALDLVRYGYGALIGHPNWRPGARPADDSAKQKS